MTFEIIVLGGGGHAKVLIDALHRQGHQVLGITDLNVRDNSPSVLGVPILGGDDIVLQYPRDRIELVNALGSVSSVSKRQQLFEKFKRSGYHFLSVIHPGAIVAADAQLSEGVQIMAGAVIQAGASIGENTIVNTRAVVEHDCKIAAHVHLAPGVVLSGSVKIGQGSHIGTGATVIQEIQIGMNSLVGAGAVVVRDIPPDTKVLGIPAREVKR